jgi:hypothetical protein
MKEATVISLPNKRKNSLNVLKRIMFYTALAVVSLSNSPARATDYHVGPGQPLAKITQVPIESLQPGDTVYIHYQATPYKEKLMLSQSGTAAQPIRIVGVPGPGGEKPILDGQDAISRSGAGNTPAYQPLEQAGVVLITRNVNQAYGVKIKYIEINGLDIRNEGSPYSFTGSDGQTYAYNPDGAGVIFYYSENITIRNCDIHLNGNGIFAKSGGDEATQTRNVMIDGNHIWDNGRSNNFFDHNVYMEAIGVVYQNNHIGPTRSGSLGSDLKDRSSGSIIRYNTFEGGQRTLDLVEAEDGWQLMHLDPNYPNAWVYGNVILNGSADADRPIHWGSDNTPSHGHHGTLYFAHNTVVIRSNQSAAYRKALFQVSTNDETVDARNNIVYIAPETAGATPSNFTLMTQYGNAVFGVNWVSPGWGSWYDNTVPQGTVTGMGSFVPSAGNDPGFVNLAGNDFHLSTTSSVINAGGALTTGWSSIVDISPFLLQQLANRGTIEPGAYFFVSPVVPASLAVSSSIVSGGQSATGTVTLNQAALIKGDSVSLSSDDPAVTVPSNVLVPEGQTSANFSITTSTVATSKTVMLTAFFNGESKTARLIVTKATPTSSVIIDDGDAGYSNAGTWTLYGAGYQSDLHYAPSGSGSTTSTWHFSGLSPGRYRVAATWPYSSVYASNAPFTISWPISAAQTVSASIAVSQATTPNDFTADGAGWKTLGVSFDVFGSTLDVQLTNAANKTVIADAVRVDRLSDLPAGGQTVTNKIIDDGATGYSTVGSWTLYGAGYQSDLHYAASGDGSATSTWTFTNLVPGRYRVAATWPYSSAYATNAPFSVQWPNIVGQAMNDPQVVSQATTPSDFTANGVGWKTFGTTYDVYGSVLTVQLTNAANKTVVGDAVRVDRTGDLPP